MKYILLFLLLGFQASAQKNITVLFDFNKYNLKPEFKQDIIKLLQASAFDSVHLEGHCDSVGTQAYNYKLSEQRVHEVAGFLLQNGINKKQISSSVAYGKDRPLNANANEAERMLNRRVQISFYYSSAKAGIAFPVESKPKDSQVKVVEVVSEQAEPIAKIDTVVSIREEMERTAYKVGSKITLPSMRFIGGFAYMVPESANSLNELLSIMRDKPDLKIEIQGHVCCTLPEEPDGFDQETKTYNLSMHRARAVYEFLVQQGIERSRMRYKGYGGSRKLFPDEKSDYEKDMNKRVEIEIID